MSPTRFGFGVILLAVVAPWATSADPDPLTSRSLDEIRKTLATINSGADKSLDRGASERVLALQRLKSYRYLAGVPYADLELDDELNRHAQAAAKLCEKLGRIDHNPRNPGLPDDDYKVALKGAQKSNLAQGAPNSNFSLLASLDLWMDDTDPRNVDRLGHRRWNLNPTMAKAGFGRAGTFAAFYAHDQSRENVPDYDYVGWPPRGLVPTEFFKRSHAWNVSLNPQKYKAPGEAVAIKVYPADAAGKRGGPALALSYKNVDVKGFGVPNSIIFRPSKVDLTTGKRYLVEISGLESATGQPATISYVVEFCRLVKK